MKVTVRKLLASVLAVLLVMALLGGCGEGNSSGFHADVFYYNYADAYIATVREAMNSRLDGMGINYTNYDGKADQATQMNDINTALSKGTNLLIVNIVDNASPDTANQIVKNAADKGVPVVFFNREPSGADVFASAGAANAAKAAFVGTNYVQAGYLEGQMIADYLLKPENMSGGTSKFDVNGDGKISYVMFRGQMDNNEAIARTLYSVLTANITLKSAGASFTLVPSELNVTTTDTSNPPNGWDYNFNGLAMDINTALTQNGFNPLSFYSVDKDSSWSSANANDMLATMFSMDGNAFTDGKIELIIANNDDMALGCANFLTTHGLNNGSGGYIPLFGVDATASARDAINAGSMTGSIEQSNVAMAQMVVTVAMNAAAGVKNLCDIGTIPMSVDGANNNMLRIPYGIVTSK